VPEEEVTRIAKRYIPQAGDGDETIIMKLDNLEKYLKGTIKKISSGRPKTGGRIKVDPSKVIFK
jgi:hypothetical protein